MFEFLLCPVHGIFAPVNMPVILQFLYFYMVSIHMYFDLYVGRFL